MPANEPMPVPATPTRWIRRTEPGATSVRTLPLSAVMCGVVAAGGTAKHSDRARRSHVVKPLFTRHASRATRHGSRVTRQANRALASDHTVDPPSHAASHDERQRDADEHKSQLERPRFDEPPGHALHR